MVARSPLIGVGGSGFPGWGGRRRSRHHKALADFHMVRILDAVELQELAQAHAVALGDG